MPQRHLRLILHGKSACDPLVREGVMQLRKQGHKIDVRVTYESGQAAEYAASTAPDIIIAGGGDGTINEVVQGLLSSGGKLPALAVLPLGTANDFARTLGIPLSDPLAALSLAAEAEPVPIDVGLVNSRPFVNVASGGFAAEITARTPQAMKDILGGAAYSITGLLTASDLKPYACKVSTGSNEVDLSISTLAIGNGRNAGGGFAVTPRAEFDDGLLDLVIVPTVPLAELPGLVSELFQPAAEGNLHILYQQLTNFELHFAEDFQLNLDGEPLVAREFRFSILPRHLRVIGAQLPKN